MLVVAAAASARDAAAARAAAGGHAWEQSVTEKLQRAEDAEAKAGLAEEVERLRAWFLQIKAENEKLAARLA